MEEQVAAGFPWGISSVGRAPALQAGGHEFESRILHLVSKIDIIYMYLENCTQIVFLKRKATSDFYDKKELRLNQFSQ